MYGGNTMKKLQIINMYKNNIIYKNNRNKLRKNSIIASVVFCLLVFSCCYVKVIGGAGADAWYNEVNYVYNPITKLYNNEDSLIFTDSDNIITNNSSFILPLISSDVRVVNNQIEIYPKENIMIVAPNAGIVEEVGKTNDGVKYIKIKHTAKISSIIEGFENFGVEKGNIVKQGEKIGTGNYSKKLVLHVLKNGKNVENLRIENNCITWD